MTQAHASRLTIALLVLLTAGCRSVPLPLAEGETPPTIRFLLTYDDGPSIRTGYNPTLMIADQLASNDVQPGIKGIFFVQTGNPKAGGSPRGQEIIKDLAARGHTIGIHSVSKTHIDHRKIPRDELIRLLVGAKAMIHEQTGAIPHFVRPPFGARNAMTQAVYADLGLYVLMADIPAHDGIIYGYKASLRRGVHIRHFLQDIMARRATDPKFDGTISVIIGFHDVNPYTAKHMTEYLHILVEEARRVGFSVPDKPFYDRPNEVQDVAISRRLTPPRFAIPEASLANKPATPAKPRSSL